MTKHQPTVAHSNLVQEVEESPCSRTSWSSSDPDDGHFQENDATDLACSSSTAATDNEDNSEANEANDYANNYANDDNGDVVGGHADGGTSYSLARWLDATLKEEHWTHLTVKSVTDAGR